MRDTRTPVQLALAQARAELSRARTVLVLCRLHPDRSHRQALEAMLTAAWLMGVPQ